MQESPFSIGLGTAAIGRPHYINLRQEMAEPFSLPSFRVSGLKMLQAAYDAGIRYFDTAPGYGIAEELMIEWIDDRGYGDVEIATKWGYTYTANFDPLAEVHEVKEHSLAKLEEQWEQSGKLLPYLSTYQIHSATFASGVLENEPVLDRLFELKSSHGLRVGLSVSGADQLEIVKRSLEIQRGGEGLFDVFQVTYNILDQSLGEMARALKVVGKRLVIKEAMANGRLFPTDRYPRYAPLYGKLEQLAKKYGVGIDAIALRFCLDSIQPFTVLSGASNQHHITDNLKALSFALEPADLASLHSFAVAPEAYWSERKLLGWN